MNHKINILFLMLLLFFSAGRVYSHKVIKNKPDTYIKNADYIVIANIKIIKTKNSKCSVKTVVMSIVKSYIKGKFKKNIGIKYEIVDFLSKKGCPSVHYLVSPRARNIKEGKDIILTLKYNLKTKKLRATSSYDIEKLAMLKKLIKKYIYRAKK